MDFNKEIKKYQAVNEQIFEICICKFQLNAL